MTASAHCLLPSCPWEATGPVDVVDLAARRHAGESGLAGGPRPGHPTALRAAQAAHTPEETTS